MFPSRVRPSLVTRVFDIAASRTRLSSVLLARFSNLHHKSRRIVFIFKFSDRPDSLAAQQVGLRFDTCIGLIGKEKLHYEPTYRFGETFAMITRGGPLNVEIRTEGNCDPIFHHLEHVLKEVGNAYLPFGMGHSNYNSSPRIHLNVRRFRWNLWNRRSLLKHSPVSTVDYFHSHATKRVT